jgi:peptide-N4-(N-acetyl-beta-glucosaminyl)asparagine amidase
MDQSWLCSRVENFYCPCCTETSQFPRINNPSVLLQTRKGRCGEFANAFTLICRSLGFHTRIVIDLSPEKGDHVWTEVFDERGEFREGEQYGVATADSSAASAHNAEFASLSPPGPRYICFDSCEGFADRPLVYEQGWGKTITRVVAVSVEGIYDVTQRYTTKLAQPLPGVTARDSGTSAPPPHPLEWLSAFLSGLNRQLLQSMGESRMKVIKRRATEANEIRLTHAQVVERLKKYGKACLKPEELLDRMSGS